jgi:uncharacterized membrane protein
MVHIKLQKEKIKNFFRIPEEDLKEEPTREFKQKLLVELTRTKIFIALVAFFLIVNALVVFDIELVYLRQIFGFLFLALIPGLLIMLCFKIREVKFWEYLVYTVGLSIAFIMFGGLAVNWTLPALGITDRPLSLYPILISFDIFLIALGVVAWKRNADLTPKNPIRLTTPKLNALNQVFFIIPMFFPILSILGAFLLNNHGPNILTMIMLGGIAVYVFLLVLFRKKLNENIWPWALWMISISLLLIYSMRSWHVLGFDINQEYYIFKITQNNSLWKMSYFVDPYNACLSLNIFPVIEDSLTNIDSELIFKFIFQITFSFMVIALYLFVNKISNKRIVSFMAALFFISQTWFGQQISWLTRQEISFIFFTLMFLVIFTKRLTLILKKALFVIFGISMIVSHYSTAYIALAIFSLTYLMILIYKVRENKKIKKGKLHASEKSEFYLTGVLVLLLLAFGFLWYSQVTPTSNSIINFAHKSIVNLQKMFSDEMLEFSLQQAFFASNPDSTVNAKEFIQNITLSYYRNMPYIDYYSSEIYQDYSTQINPPPIIKYNYSYNMISSLYKSFNILKIILNYFFILFGVLLFCFNRDNKFFFMVCVVSLGLLGAIISFPSASSSYNLTRFYMQLMILLTITAIIGGLRLLKITRINIPVLCAVLVIYLLFSSGFIAQIFGGPAFVNLNNLGKSYEEYYIHESEILSSNYLFINFNKNYLLYADYVSILRLNHLRYKIKILKNIFPGTMSKNSYVYASETNIQSERTFNAIGKSDLSISFNFPTIFLNNNKNKIYTNGGSQIFK